MIAGPLFGLRCCRSLRAAATLIAVLVTVPLSACSEGGGPTTPPETPSLELALSSGTVSVVQGQAATVDVALVRGGGFSAPVTVVLEGAPAGLSASFAPASVPATSSNTTLTLTAGSSLAAGSYGMVVRASGVGVPDRATVITLTVTDEPAVALSVMPAAATAHQGSSAVAAALLTRIGGYTGAVDLSLEGAPAGLTAQFSPAQLGPGSDMAVLTLAVGSAVGAGTHNMTVRARGAGVTDRTAPLSVTVTVPPSINLAVNPVALSVVQGGSVGAGISVTRGGGYSGAVDLSMEGAPAGVGAVFTPDQFTGSTASGTLGLAVASAVLPGTYTLTIRARGAGLEDRTAVVALTVSAATPPGFSIGLAPGSLTLQQGTSGVVRLMATRSGGFSGPLTISATGAPAGVTVAPQSTAMVGDTLSLSLTAAGIGAAGPVPQPGAYNLIVSAQAPGVAPRTLNLPLTVTAAPVGYTLTTSPSAVSIQAGSTGRAAVRIGRGGGYTGAVALTVSGTTAGLTATLVDANTTADSVELAISVGASVTAGTYGLTVRGAVTGLTDRTGIVNVTVTAVPTPPTGTFSLSVVPSALSLVAGANATASVAIARTGVFGAPVTLSVTGAPAGLTPALDSTVVGGPGTMLRVSAASTLPAGSYSLVVRGNAAGQPERTAGLTVTVAPAPVTGNITLRFCGNDIPGYFAAQNGNGPWVRVSGVNGQFSFDINGRGAVAYLDDGNGLTVVRASEGEFQALAAGTCMSDDEVTGSKKFLGEVSNVGVGNRARVVLGLAAANPDASTPCFDLVSLPEGTLELIAARLQLDPGTGSYFPNKFLLRRDINRPNNFTLPIMDFAGPEAFDPASGSIAISGVGGDSAVLSIAYRPVNSGLVFGGEPFYYSGRAPLGGAWPGIPAARQRGGDLHRITLVAPSGIPGASRGEISYLSATGSVALNLGPVLSSPAMVTVATTPYLRVRVQLAYQPEYDDVLTVRFAQGSRAAVLVATGAYVAGGPWDVDIPDLSAVGFNPAWGLGSGTVSWTAKAFNYSGGGSPLAPTPANGAYQRYATSSGVFVP